jgi:hypothetical protein
MEQQQQKSFVDKVISKKAHLIHKIKAIDSTGRWAYYFLLVEPMKEKAFMDAMNSDADEINLEDYGQIVASNYGEEPSEEVRTMLKDKYDFDV